MRQVSGFITEGGAFYEDEREASLAEARDELFPLLENAGVNPERFELLLQDVGSSLYRYLQLRYSVDEEPKGRAPKQYGGIV